MKRYDFRAQALILVASALVKVMDEKVYGVVDNQDSHRRIAENAISIVKQLDDVATEAGICFDDEVDWEKLLNS